MEALVREGLVRSIGLWGGTLEALQSVMGVCKIPPAVIATELHPHCCNLDLLDFCKAKVRISRALLACSPTHSSPAGLA